jgi:adenine-specific DNA-methyltransferase
MLKECFGNISGSGNSVSNKFRRQRPIGSYIVDFVCLEKELIIEVDGDQHDERKEYDEKRTRWLESQGFTVLRFSDHEVLTEIESVREVIWNELEDAPSLILPRNGGEEE